MPEISYVAWDSGKLGRHGKNLKTHFLRTECLVEGTPNSPDRVTNQSPLK